MARRGVRLRINEGQTARHKYTFRDADGAVYDPTTVTAYVREPDGVLNTYVYPTTVVKVSTGIYYVDIAGTKPGQYTSRLKGTATGYSDADEVRIEVLAAIAT